MRDRFGIFGAVIRIRKLSLLFVMTLGCYTTSALPILTVGESEAVVLCYKGEEYYVGTLLHELSG